MTLSSRPEVEVLADASGALAAASPLPQFGAQIPRYLDLRDEMLYWSLSWDPRTEQAPSHNAEATGRMLFNPGKPAKPAGMLDAFVRIKEKADVLRFAERYGVLDICEHGLPGSHNPPPLPLTGQLRRCRAWGEQQYVYWEPVDIWLRYVAQMRALLSLAVDLRASSPGRMADWKLAYSQLRWSEEIALLALDQAGKEVERDRIFLGERVSTWMQFGNVRPELFWEQNSLANFRLSGHTFGVLGIQLLFAATRAQGIYFCYGCGMPYGPKRKPRKDRRNFCSNCGAKVAARLRKQASRAQAKKGAEHG